MADLSQMEVVLVPAANPAANTIAGQGVVFLHCMACGATQWAHGREPMTVAGLVELAETHNLCTPEGDEDG